MTEAACTRPRDTFGRLAGDDGSAFAQAWLATAVYTDAATPCRRRGDLVAGRRALTSGAPAVPSGRCAEAAADRPVRRNDSAPKQPPTHRSRDGSALKQPPVHGSDAMAVRRTGTIAKAHQSGRSAEAATVRRPVTGKALANDLGDGGDPRERVLFGSERAARGGTDAVSPTVTTNVTAHVSWSLRSIRAFVSRCTGATRVAWSRLRYVGCDVAISTTGTSLIPAL